MLLILLSLKKKLYSYCKVVINLKFYVLSIFLHLVILLTIFIGDTHIENKKENSVFFEIQNFPEAIPDKEIDVPVKKSTSKKEVISKTFSHSLEKVMDSNEIINKPIPDFGSTKSYAPLNEPLESDNIEKEKTFDNYHESNTTSIPSPLKEGHDSSNSLINPDSDLGQVATDDISTFSNKSNEDLNLIKENDNYYIKNQDVSGISYKILESPEPNYPIMAKKANIKDQVIIKVRFSVNELGKIENIKFYDTNEKYGFHEEVVKALENWSFTPVSYNNKVVKMYFYKVFIFKIK